MAVRRFIHTLLLLAALFAWAAPAPCQPAKGLNELGGIAFDAKRYMLALGHFEKALAQEPDNPVIRRNLCAVHQAIADELATENKLPEAIKRVQLGLAVDPENPSALAQAGAYYLKSGQLPEAAAQLEASVRSDPGYMDACFLLGEVYYQQNRLPEAREQWERVLKVEPERPGLQEKYDKLARESDVEQDFNRYAEGHFELSYAKALSEETRAIVFRVLEEAYQSVGAKLGGIFPPGAVQVVLYDGGQFSEATGLASHVGALYDGKIRAPITGRNGRFLDERTLRVRLTHEYTHVALVGYVGPKLPWWLNEGMAEVFSREMDLSRKRLLRGAYKETRTMPLHDLEGSQIDKLEPKALSVAYAEAHAAADLLWRAGGTEKLASLLKLLKAGTAMGTALPKIYSQDYAALDQAVADAYK